MPTLAISTVVPLWLAAPLAAVALLIVASHLLASQHVIMPPSRRWIRTANGLVMLLTIPVLTFAASLARTEREFVLSWMLVLGLNGIVVSLAITDAVNNARINFRTIKKRKLARSWAPEGGHSESQS